MKKFLLLVAVAATLAFTACGAEEPASVSPLVSQVSVNELLGNAAPEADIYLVQMGLQGMVCSACEATVTDIVEDLGAVVAGISAANDSLSISLDPSIVTMQQIVDALAEEGYTVQR
jgi:copper chaperone CopZ